MKVHKAVLIVCNLLIPTWSLAQGPENRGTSGPYAMIARMMAFDKNKDGKLTRSEITDERLMGLFDRADGNNDGVVTKEELKASFSHEISPFQGAGPGGPPNEFGPRGPGFGPGGPGAAPGFGPGGPGGFGGPRGRGFGGPPRPGQILSGFIQDSLNLSDEQKKQLDKLQKEVDAKLGKILTAVQKKQLSEFRGRGPGGPGGFGPPPGGPGGFGPPPTSPGEPGGGNRPR